MEAHHYNVHFAPQDASSQMYNENALTLISAVPLIGFFMHTDSMSSQLQMSFLFFSMITKLISES